MITKLFMLVMVLYTAHSESKHPAVGIVKVVSQTRLLRRGDMFAKLYKDELMCLQMGK